MPLGPPLRVTRDGDHGSPLGDEPVVVENYLVDDDLGLHLLTSVVSPGDQSLISMAPKEVDALVRRHLRCIANASRLILFPFLSLNKSTIINAFFSFLFHFIPQPPGTGPPHPPTVAANSPVCQATSTGGASQGEAEGNPSTLRG